MYICGTAVSAADDGMSRWAPISENEERVNWSKRYHLEYRMKLGDMIASLLTSVDQTFAPLQGRMGFVCFSQKEYGSYTSPSCHYRKYCFIIKRSSLLPAARRYRCRHTPCETHPTVHETTFRIQNPFGFHRPSKTAIINENSAHSGARKSRQKNWGLIDKSCLLLPAVIATCTCCY